MVEMVVAMVMVRMRFSVTFSTKKKSLDRIERNQRLLDRNSNPFLINLDQQLIQELIDVFDQEKNFWMLKSKVQWLWEEDHNTRFFHISTRICGVMTSRA